MTTRELLQMALEALKDGNGLAADLNSKGCFDEEITAISAHLAKPEPEPVAWVRRHPDGALTAEFLEHDVIEPVRKNSGAWVPLYTKDQP